MYRLITLLITVKHAAKHSEEQDFSITIVCCSLDYNLILVYEKSNQNFSMLFPSEVSWYCYFIASDGRPDKAELVPTLSLSGLNLIAMMVLFCFISATICMNVDFARFALAKLSSRCYWYRAAYHLGFQCLILYLTPMDSSLLTTVMFYKDYE